MTDNVLKLEQSSRNENDALPIPLAAMKTKNDAITELSQLDNDVSREESGHQESLRTHLKRAAELAEKLRNDPNQWEHFTHHERWKGTKHAPKQKDRNDALRFVIRWLYSLRQNGSKLANKYYKAVAALLDEGISPSDVAHGLKERGIEALAYPASAARKRPSSAIAIKKRIQSMEKAHGKPKFILKTVGVFEGAPTSDQPLSLIGLWISEDANRGHFLVHEVNQDFDRLLTRASPE